MGGKQNGLVVLAAKDGWRISEVSTSESVSRVLEFNTTFKFNRDKCKGTKQRQT
jgi:hypothetical protein